jgi:intracellular multiplication protein IcmL
LNVVVRAGAGEAVIRSEQEAVMQNQAAAVNRRLSDPDFQGWIVRNSLLVVMVLSVLLAVFVIHDAYVWTHPTKPVYFFVDGRNPPTPAVALDSPIVDDTELLEWSVKWVLAPYNVNYHDFAQQLNAAGQHYTRNGWSSFGASYIKGGNFDEMQRARLTCFAQAQRSAVIRQTSIVGGHLAYQIQFPMVQTCENVNQQSTSNLVMTATIIRMNDQDHPDGLAIDQLTAKAY